MDCRPFPLNNICEIQNLYTKISILEKTIHDCCGSSGPAACVAPVIIGQPISQTLIDGDKLILNVQVTGTQPFLYQWKKDGVAIPGAVFSSYIIPATSISDQATYSVSVSNACGTVISAGADVLISEPCVAPAITVQPISQEVNEGGNVTFSVVATGTITLNYQWKKNGVNIVGQTASSLTLSNVSSADEALYTVSISNSCGTITSVAATLTVDPLIVTFLAYWGWVDDISTINSDIAIQAGQGSGTFPDGGDITADYTPNSDPKILWMAEPSGQPVKSTWYGSDNNTGNIGSDLTDAFHAPVIVQSYRLYYTNYLTQQTQTTLQFRV